MGVEDRFRRLEYRLESDLSYDESKRPETILLKRCDFENIPEKNFARLQSQRSTEQEWYRVCISLNEILINVSKQEETLANSFSTFIIIHLSLAELKQRRSR